MQGSVILLDFGAGRFSFSNFVQVKENGPGDIFNVEIKIQFKNHTKIICVKTGGQIDAIWSKRKAVKFVAKILCWKKMTICLSCLNLSSEHWVIQVSMSLRHVCCLGNWIYQDWRIKKLPFIMNVTMETYPILSNKILSGSIYKLKNKIKYCSKHWTLRYSMTNSGVRKLIINMNMLKSNISMFCGPLSQHHARAFVI